MLYGLLAPSGQKLYFAYLGIPATGAVPGSQETLTEKKLIKYKLRMRRNYVFYLY